MSRANGNVDAFIEQIESEPEPTSEWRTWVGLAVIRVPRDRNVHRMVDVDLDEHPRLNTKRLKTAIVDNGDRWIKMEVAYTAHGASSGDPHCMIARAAKVPKDHVVVECVRIDR